MDIKKIHFVLDDNESMEDVHSIEFLSHRIVIFNAIGNEKKEIIDARFGLTSRLAFEVEGSKELILYIETNMFNTGEIHTFNGDPLIMIDEASTEGQIYLEQLCLAMPDLATLAKGEEYGQ
jgi:hypothetical protein